MTWVTIEHDGHAHRLALVTTPQGTWVGWPGGAHFFPKESRRATSSGPANSRHDEIRAPMTGTVVEVKVADGDHVSSGDMLIVMEAMKMEYRLTAPHDAVIEAVHCNTGDLVELGKSLVTLAEP